MRPRLKVFARPMWLLQRCRKHEVQKTLISDYLGYWKCTRTAEQAYGGSEGTP